jgi:hypothetical protein
MARQSYQRLSPADIDEIRVRLRAAAKPTARALGMPISTVRAHLIRCGGIRPDPRGRSAGRLSLAEREEISRGLAAGSPRVWEGHRRRFAVRLPATAGSVDTERWRTGRRGRERRDPSRAIATNPRLATELGVWQAAKFLGEDKPRPKALPGDRSTRRRRGSGRQVLPDPSGRTAVLLQAQTHSQHAQAAAW